MLWFLHLLFTRWLFSLLCHFHKHITGVEFTRLTDFSNILEIRAEIHQFWYLFIVFNWHFSSEELWQSRQDSQLGESPPVLSIFFSRERFRRISTYIALNKVWLQIVKYDDKHFFLFFINRALLFPEFQSKKKYIFCSTFNWPFHNFRGSFYTSTVMFKKCFRHVHTSLLNSEQIWFCCNFRAGNCRTGSRTRLAQNENTMRSRHLGVNRFRVAVNDGPEKKTN